LRLRKVIFLLLILFSLNLFAGRVVFVGNLKLSPKKTFFSVFKNLLFGKNKINFSPFAVAVLSNGDFVITDIDTPALILADKDGVIKKVVYKIGNVPLGAPVSVWVDSQDGIYLVDSVRKGVVVFDSSLTQWEIFKADDGKRYTSVCVKGDNVFLSDVANHRVECYSKSGKFKFSFGKRGTGDGEFNYPSCLTVCDDFLVVLDALNFRVQLFDFKGNFLGKFGKAGDGGGSFSKPKGIAVVKNKIVAVSDVAFDNIQLFDLKGNFLYFFGRNGVCEQCFVMPSGIFSQNDLIYVCDRWNKRVSIWRVETER